MNDFQNCLVVYTEPESNEPRGKAGFIHVRLEMPRGKSVASSEQAPNVFARHIYSADHKQWPSTSRQKVKCRYGEASKRNIYI